MNPTYPVVGQPSPTPSPELSPGEKFVFSPEYWCVMFAGLVAVWALRRLHIRENGSGPGRG